MNRAKILFMLLVTTGTAASINGHDITMQKIKLNGMAVTVGKETVAVEPLPLIEKKLEIALKTGKPGWRGPVYTPGTAWIFNAMTPGSLKVYDGEKPLKEGADYLVDYAWGTIGAAEGSAAASVGKVRIEYSFSSSRLDLVVRTRDGKLELIKGKQDSRKPLLPKAPEGSTSLFSIYLPPNTVKLSEQNINIIDPDTKPYGPANGTEYLQGKLKKLKSGEPFTFVFFGDSITAQTDPEGGSFVSRFTDWTRKTYPERKVHYLKMTRDNKAYTVATAKKGEITIVMAGVGGDDTVRGLQRIDKHVLAHKPDIVVIMFGVNDENRRGKTNVVPPDKYALNLTAIVEKVREAGGEPLIMTTSMKNLGWDATVGNLHEYAAKAREVAKQNKVCLVDNFRAWENLPKRGYNYMIPLGSCINHPNDMGHVMFFEGIRAVLSE